MRHAYTQQNPECWRRINSLPPSPLFLSIYQPCTWRVFLCSLHLTAERLLSSGLLSHCYRPVLMPCSHDCVGRLLSSNQKKLIWRIPFWPFFLFFFLPTLSITFTTFLLLQWHHLPQQTPTIHEAGTPCTHAFARACSSTGIVSFGVVYSVLPPPRMTLLCV